MPQNQLEAQQVAGNTTQHELVPVLVEPSFSHVETRDDNGKNAAYQVKIYRHEHAYVLTVRMSSSEPILVAPATVASLLPRLQNGN